MQVEILESHILTTITFVIGGVFMALLAMCWRMTDEYDRDLRIFVIFMTVLVGVVMGLIITDVNDIFHIKVVDNVDWGGVVKNVINS